MKAEPSRVRRVIEFGGAAGEHPAAHAQQRGRQLGGLKCRRPPAQSGFNRLAQLIPGNSWYQVAERLVRKLTCCFDPFSAAFFDEVASELETLAAAQKMSEPEVFRRIHWENGTKLLGLPSKAKRQLRSP